MTIRNRDLPTLESAMESELEVIEVFLHARRDELMQGPLNEDSMGRMHALGQVDSAVWHLLRRIRGEE